jgi:hypothetical protein
MSDELNKVVTDSAESSSPVTDDAARKSTAAPSSDTQHSALSTQHFSLGAGFDWSDPNSPLAHFYLTRAHVAAVGFLALVFAVLSHFPVWHTDFWGHLRFGEYIVQNHALPKHETFSGDFADQQAEYVNFQWLAQAGGYLLFDLGRHLAGGDADAQLGGGALMLSLAHATILTLRLALLLAAFRRLTHSIAWALAGVVLVTGMAAFNHLWILRPQVLGELAFAALLLALSRPVLSRRALVGVPLVMVFWANAHGSFPIGFVLLGTFLAGRVLQAAWNVERNKPRSALRALRFALHSERRLAIALLLSIAAVALLNPHGPALFLRSWELAGNRNVRDMEEWKPLSVTGLAGYVFLGSVALLVPLLRWSPRPFTPTQVLLLLGFGVESLLHARVLTWWTTIFVWVILPHLQAVCEPLWKGQPREEKQASLRWTVLAGLVAGVLLLWSLPAQWALWGERPSGMRRVVKGTPLREAQLLKERYARDPGRGRVVYTSETLGEYLLWDLRLEPPVRVFAYTHAHLLTRAHWREWLQIKAGEPGWQEILDRHGVDYLVVERSRFEELVGMVKAAAERWEIVTDDAIVVAHRTSGPDRR